MTFPSRRPSAVLGALVLLAAGSLAATPVRAAEPAGTPAPAAAAAKPAARIDLNSATEAELLTLPKVGPATAQRILEYRKQVGTIRSVDELVNVKGIGEKTLEILRPLVTVSAPAAKEAKKS